MNEHIIEFEVLHLLVECYGCRNRIHSFPEVTGSGSGPHLKKKKEPDRLL